jgi:hypothetical protein
VEGEVRGDWEGVGGGVRLLGLTDVETERWVRVRFNAQFFIVLIHLLGPDHGTTLTVHGE